MHTHCETILQSVCTILHFHQPRARESPSGSVSSPALGTLSVLCFSNSSGCVEVAPVVLICISRMASDVDCLSCVCVFYHIYTCLGEVSVHVFAHVYLGCLFFTIGIRSRIAQFENWRVHCVGFKYMSPVCSLHGLGLLWLLSSAFYHVRHRDTVQVLWDLYPSVLFFEKLL